MDIPVVFIIYNRPEKTRRSFAAIRAVQPAVLYLVADGPKHEQDAQLVAQTRQIAEQVDWECRVTRIYSSENLTCGYRISSGLDAVFSECDKAIILEDDIVATPAFFTFCSRMLHQYETDSNVMAVTGWNGLVSYQAENYDAFMNKYVSVWGWATWRRAWATYQFDPVWPTSDFNERLSTYAPNSFWLKIYQHIYAHKLWHRYQTWDFQWALSIFYHHGLVITPTVNLCQNIGFDTEGTHLTAFNLNGLLPAFDRIFSNEPLRINETYDNNFDYSILLLSRFTLYHDIRKLFLFYKNPQLLPNHQSRVGWECSLQPFNEPERCLQILAHLNGYVDHPEIAKYRSVFQKLLKDNV